MLGCFFYSMLLQSLHLLMGGDYRALRGASKSPYGCSPGTGSGGRSPSAGQSPSPAASRKKKARPRPFHAAAPPSIPAAEAVLYYTDICPSPFFFFLLSVLSAFAQSLPLGEWILCRKHTLRYNVLLYYETWP